MWQQALVSAILLPTWTDVKKEGWADGLGLNSSASQSPTGAFNAASCSLSILLHLPSPSTPLPPKNNFCPSLNSFGTCQNDRSQLHGFGVEISTHQTLRQLIHFRSLVSCAALLSCSIPYLNFCRSNLKVLAKICM